MRDNPALDEAAIITELGVGEALVSCLDEKGRPAIVERALILPPTAQIGPISPEQRQTIISQSLLAGHYEQNIDRDSAYEKLKQRASVSAATAPADTQQQPASGGWLDDILGNNGQPGSVRRRENALEAMTKSAARAIGSEVGRRIIRGVLGSLLGGNK
ncbi:hypothetical protein GALL_545690 [mine drainage metagenome]|uniref:Helicase HerA-like C-terminal domain-containing protein n=1 Tax=mine drainage metagenome TaxID=410659 RepID=A0A1J5P024_9ZZZZ